MSRIKSLIAVAAALAVSSTETAASKETAGLPWAAGKAMEGIKKAGFEVIDVRKKARGSRFEYTLSEGVPDNKRDDVANAIAKRWGGDEAVKEGEAKGIITYKAIGNKIQFFSNDAAEIVILM